eukprot:6191528-Pleurochrysis_carterae.AAC.1
MGLFAAARAWLVAIPLLFCLPQGSGVPSVDVTATASLRPGSGLLPEMGLARFGASVVLLGSNQLAVGAPYSPGNGSLRGEVYFLSLDADYTLWMPPKTVGDEQLALSDFDLFGSALSMLRLDGSDNRMQLAVSAPTRNTLYILNLTLSLDLLSSTTIVAGVDLVTGFSMTGSSFGTALCSLPDLDDNGVEELVVCAKTGNDRILHKKK